MFNQILISFFSLVMITATPLALAAEERKAPTNTRTTPALSQNFYKKLSQIQKLLDEEKYNEALEVLQKTLQRKLNSYEAAMTYNMQGFTHFQLNDVAAATVSYDNLLKQENLPLALETRTLFTMAQIQFSEENYQSALDYLFRWEKLVEVVSADAHALFAQTYYQLGNHEKSVEWIAKAVGLAEKKGKKPQENWLLVWQSSLLELNRPKQRVAIVEKLTAYYPKTQYLLNLAGAYGLLEQTKQQLSTLELVYRRGELTQEPHLLHLAQLLYHQQVPIKAAEVLSLGIERKQIERNEKNLQLLATFLRSAKEFKRSLPTLEAASELSKNGKIDMQLANSYYHIGEWEKAINSVDKALKKGGDVNKDSALLLKGQAGLKAKQFEIAIAAFDGALSAALESDSIHQENAGQWLAYAKRAKARHEALTN